MQARVTTDQGALTTDGPAGSPGGHDANGGGITVQTLRAAFPEWRIFQQSGKWWALRGGPVRLDGPESLLRRTVTACGLTKLAEKLCVQYRLDRLDPQELAAAYLDMTLPGSPAEPRHERACAGSRPAQEPGPVFDEQD